MAKAIAYVASYEGENLLVDEMADAQGEIAAEAERALSRAQGRWIASIKERKALEQHGMKRAIAYFSKRGCLEIPEESKPTHCLRVLRASA